MELGLVLHDGTRDAFDGTQPHAQRAAVPAQPLPWPQRPLRCTPHTPSCRARRPWPDGMGLSSEPAAAKLEEFLAGIWRELKISGQRCFYAHPCPVRSRRFLTHGVGCEWGGQRVWSEHIPLRIPASPPRLQGFPPLPSLFNYIHGVCNYSHCISR